MFSRLSLRTKFLLAPVICAIFLLTLTVAHFVSLSRQQSNIQDIQEHAVPAYELASTAANRLDQVVDMLNTAATTGDVDQLDAAKAVFNKLRADLVQIAEHASAQKGLVNDGDKAAAAYFESAANISSQMAAGKLDLSKAAELSQTMRGQLKQAQAALQRLKEVTYEGVTATLSNINQDSQNFGITLVIAMAVFGSLSFVTAVVMSRAVARNVAEITLQVRELAQGRGDLTHRLPKNSQDEIGVLVDQFNQFLIHLHSVVRQLVERIQSLENVAGLLDVAVERSENLAHQENEALHDTAVAIQTIPGSVVPIPEG